MTRNPLHEAQRLVIYTTANVEQDDVKLQQALTESFCGHKRMPQTLACKQHIIKLYLHNKMTNAHMRN